MKRLLSTGEVAEMLGVNRQKVCSLIAAAKLKGVDLSTGQGVKPRWGVPTESVESFLNGGTLPTALPAQKQSRRQRLDTNVPKVFG